MTLPPNWTYRGGSSNATITAQAPIDVGACRFVIGRVGAASSGWATVNLFGPTGTLLATASV